MVKRTLSAVLSVLMLMPAMPVDQDAQRDKAMLALERLVEAQPKRKKAAVMGDWLLFPDGFGLLIPEGLEQIKPERGVTLSLREPAERDTSALTNITLTITDEVQQLDLITPKAIESAGRGMGVDKFELISMTHDEFLGSESLLVAFFMNSSPRLVSVQRMFNHGGKYYVLTLSAEQRHESFSVAMEQFIAFCDSFFFIEGE